jgi:hypothetical protein
MRTKTRLAKLPKKDRDEVVRLNVLHLEEAPSPVDYVAKRNWKGAPSRLATAFHLAKMYLEDEAILRRLLDDDVTQMAICLDTASRFGFLLRTAGGNEFSGGHDCQHVFDVLTALAVNDQQLIQAFVRAFPGPFKAGHPATVLLANGVYAVICADRSAYPRFVMDLRSKSESKYFQAIFRAIAAIMEGSTTELTQELAEMAKGNRSQSMHGFLQKHVCLQAHALYQLCLGEFAVRNIAAPLPPDHQAWDMTFHENVITRGKGSAVYFDFADPVLAKWIATLPTQMPADDVPPVP